MILLNCAQFSFRFYRKTTTSASKIKGRWGLGAEEPEVYDCASPVARPELKREGRPEQPTEEKNRSVAMLGGSQIISKPAPHFFLVQPFEVAWPSSRL